MMQMVLKWQVVFGFAEPEQKGIKIYLYGNFSSEILKKVSDINFDCQPSYINIKLISNHNEQITGVRSK